jgi:hypothetical protein
MSKRLHVCLSAAAAFFVLVTAACSDDSESSAGSTTAATSAATTAATGPTSTLDPVVGNVDLGPLAGCQFFTPADAKAFLGRDVGPVNMRGSQVEGDTILAVCAYNDLSGQPENGVSVSAKLVPGSGNNLQGDLLDLEQNRYPGFALEPVEGVGDGARAFVIPGTDINLLFVFAGEYELDLASGPNQTMDELVQLAKDTIPKLPQS